MYQPPGPSGPPPPFGNTPPPFGGGTPPPFGGAPQPFAPGPPPRRSKGPAIAAIGCGALVVVIVLVVVLMTILDNDEKRVVISQQPQQSGQPQQSVPPQNAPPNNTPVTGGFGPDYAGTWQGTVIQTKPTTNKYTVTIVIQQNSTTGQITYQNDPGADTTWSCTGTVQFLHTTPGADYKSVVREQITSKNNAKCDTYSYNVLFPKPDNTGGPGDGMFIKNYFSESVADADNDHNAIGELKRQN